MNELLTDKTFEGHNFVENSIVADFEDCVFKSCFFAKAKLSNLSFTNCTFENCDLSGANLHKAAFQDCEFISCKMLGMGFDTCASFLFQITCDSCLLNFSNFYKVDLTSSQFIKCQLKEVDFTEANLSGISLTECDLAGSTFEQTNLQKTDFSSALNYTLIPEHNKVTGAIFSKEGLPGLLNSYKIKIV
ncbi:pentapeptide repeat-containing protein [Leeuwenhoekiella sp. MAR_2009_132]|uniref:pentapeptide repeat-containing protein n=1 Tax=Leeuwenhoekiella sp. MAR_2009_132 TaxID=1392489 RepID=UPI00055D136B|nr:pentapeptide repeat-containing protein [Leeuwenhoekiella sp. MAR_2009_132]